MTRTALLFRMFVGLNTFMAANHTLPADEPTDVLSRIVFGSCIRQDRPMPILRTIADTRPQLILFLGDNIYADTSDMEVMREKYALLGANPDFQRLRQSAPILATWDDHDYGLNDGGATYAQRKAAQQVFFDFWKQGAPDDHKGVYQSHVYGPPGKRVQVILLDIRYFRSPLKTGERRVGGPYYPDDSPRKTMLGEAQWQWLKQQVQQPAEIRLVASGIQVVASAAGQETWANFPRERRRLLDLIAETKAAGVILLSGDRHWAELSAVTEGVPYPLYDMTSSSFNQIHPRGTPTENEFRAAPKTWHQPNFGLIDVDWAADDPTITMQVRDVDGHVRIEKTLTLSQLQPR